MKPLQAFLRSLFLILLPIALQLSGNGVAQDRTAGRTRNPDQVGSATQPTPSVDTGRDIGRTRIPETPPPVPPPKEGRDGGRTDPPPKPVTTEGTSVPSPQPPPRGGRYPHHQPASVPDPQPCIDAVVIDSYLPEASTGYWIRDGLTCGKDVTLSDAHSMPEYSGFDFSDLRKRPLDDPLTDMYVESDSGELFMVLRDDSEIMDIGVSTIPLDAIFVQRKEWAPGHFARLFYGHEYVLRTWDYHYAKFVVRGILQDRVIFDWAYQHEDGDKFLSSTLRSPSSVRFSRR